VTTFSLSFENRSTSWAMTFSRSGTGQPTFSFTTVYWGSSRRSEARSVSRRARRSRTAASVIAPSRA
jgi:hypothetical protein